MVSSQIKQTHVSATDTNKSIPERARIDLYLIFIYVISILLIYLILENNLIMWSFRLMSAIIIHYSVNILKYRDLYCLILNLELEQ